MNNKLTPHKCIIGNLNIVTNNYFNGLSNPNTELMGLSGDQTVLSGVFNLNPKYSLYHVNDTTTTKKPKVIRYSVKVTYTDTSEQDIVLLIPCRVPVKIYIPISILSIPSGQSIESIRTGAIAPTVGTLSDAYIEFNYTQ